jgi:hypothetical protein
MHPSRGKEGQPVDFLSTENPQGFKSIGDLLFRRSVNFRSHRLEVIERQGRRGDAVEQRGAVAVVGEIVKDVKAREAIAAAAIGPFVGPGEMLGLLVLDRLPDVGVSAPLRGGVIVGFQGAARRDCREDRCYSLQPLSKPHVVVPLVRENERFHSASSRMARVDGQFRLPPWIHRPEWLEVAAKPVEIVVSLFALLDLEALMDRHEASSPPDGIRDPAIRRSTPAVVHDDDDRMLDGAGFRSFLVRIDDCLGIRVHDIDGACEVDLATFNVANFGARIRGGCRSP